MADWHAGDTCFLALAQLGERYRRYRLPDPDAEAAMAGSFQRYGQLAPVVVCLREETHEILDGFKRLAAARALGLKTLSTRLIEADERMAKAAIHGLNQVGRRPQEWEEAWIVHALVRDDGMTQVEVAELLGRHKSWVCRRLALVEKLSNEAREDLRLVLGQACAVEFFSGEIWKSRKSPRFSGVFECSCSTSRDLHGGFSSESFDFSRAGSCSQGAP